MSGRPWSDADRELVARTWYEAETPDRRLPAAWTETGRSYREHADAVLDALTAAGWRPAREFLPAASEALDRHAARVRAEVVGQIAQAIEAQRERAKAYHYRAALDKAAAIARAHRTTPTNGDHDA